MELPTKNEIAVTERVISQVPMGIYEALMKEINDRNERRKDNSDAAFFVPFGLQLITEQLRKEREDVEKARKEKKQTGLHTVQPVVQSA